MGFAFVGMMVEEDDVGDQLLGDNTPFFFFNFFFLVELDKSFLFLYAFVDL